ncbi:MAG: ATP-dependent 6-phosphofructokinase [Spirochaetales bacterium]|nr:ATP-dependent 6-phosphofructokinase [Spirochaetales bacterium]
MEDLNINEEDLHIESLGTPALRSPLKLSTVYGDQIANYVEDTESVLFYSDKNMILEKIKENEQLPAFEKAGPRYNIFFEPSNTKAAIVTCGGLCPGINNVIRSLVMELFYRYGVPVTYGIRYGYQGFIPEYGYEPLLLTPDLVKDIHMQGGSILASSRGKQDVGKIVDTLSKLGVSILFTIGGDGTLRGAHAIHEEVKKRRMSMSIIGVPKTIDNDISFVEQTFGLETAFSIAGFAIRSAHTEAIGAPNGIGLVKVMGRLSGFIAANAALALNEVNFVLVPEIPFDLEGPNGLYTHLETRLKKKGHAVIVVAEGAGQELLATASSERDASGNPKLGDIGIFLKTAIKEYFTKKISMEVNLKYIDPSYMIRSVPANAHDAIFCMQLAQNAVHAGMAGKSGMVVGIWNGKFTHIPLALVTSRNKYLSPEDSLWLSVLEATGQPYIMKNGEGTAGR